MFAALACDAKPSTPLPDPSAASGEGHARPPENADAPAGPPAGPASVAERQNDPWTREDLDSLRPLPRFDWPVERPHLTSLFGWRTDPVAGAGLRLHRGIDLRGARGDLVMTIGPGVVRFAGRDAALGNLVIVDHAGGISSWYGHLSSLAVHDGLRLQAGASIGAVGNTGRSAAPHLHLTMKKTTAGGDEEVAVDPLNWLG